MAVDKLVDSAQLDSDLEDIADAIRAKSGGSSPLAFPAGFVSEIGSIPSGGGGTQVMTKLGEYTISEPVNAIDITLPEQYANGGSVYLNFKDVVSEDPYLYFGMNANGVGYFSISTLGGSPINALFSAIWAVDATIDNKSVSGAFTVFRSTTDNDRTVTQRTRLSTAEILKIHSYISSNRFTSGTIEVWGYV